LQWPPDGPDFTASVVAKDFVSLLLVRAAAGCLRCFRDADIAEFHAAWC
jgi:hypothetical protein